MDSRWKRLEKLVALDHNEINLRFQVRDDAEFLPIHSGPIVQNTQETVGDRIYSLNPLTERDTHTHTSLINLCMLLQDKQEDVPTVCVCPQFCLFCVAFRARGAGVIYVNIYRAAMYELHTKV